MLSFIFAIYTINEEKIKVVLAELRQGWQLGGQIPIHHRQHFRPALRRLYADKDDDVPPSANLQKRARWMGPTDTSEDKADEPAREEEEEERIEEKMAEALAEVRTMVAATLCVDPGPLVTCAK